MYRFISITVIILIILMFYKDFFESFENSQTATKSPHTILFDRTNFDNKKFSIESNKNNALDKFTYKGFVLEKKTDEGQHGNFSSYLNYLGNYNNEESISILIEATIESFESEMIINKIPIVIEKPTTNIGIDLVQNNIHISDVLNFDMIEINIESIISLTIEQPSLEISLQDPQFDWIDKKFKYVYLTNNSAEGYISLNPHAIPIANKHIIVQILVSEKDYPFGNEKMRVVSYKFFVNGITEDCLVVPEFLYDGKIEIENKNVLVTFSHFVREQKIKLKKQGNQFIFMWTECGGNKAIKINNGQLIPKSKVTYLSLKCQKVNEEGLIVVAPLEIIQNNIRSSSSNVKIVNLNLDVMHTFIYTLNRVTGYISVYIDGLLIASYTPSNFSSGNVYKFYSFFLQKQFNSKFFYNKLSVYPELISNEKIITLSPAFLNEEAEIPTASTNFSDETNPLGDFVFDSSYNEDEKADLLSQIISETGESGLFLDKLPSKIILDLPEDIKSENLRQYSVEHNFVIISEEEDITSVTFGDKEIPVNENEEIIMNPGTPAEMKFKLNVPVNMFITYDSKLIKTFLNGKEVSSIPITQIPPPVINIESISGGAVGLLRNINFYSKNLNSNEINRSIGNQMKSDNIDSIQLEMSREHTSELMKALQENEISEEKLQQQLQNINSDYEKTLQDRNEITEEYRKHLESEFNRMTSKEQDTYNKLKKIEKETKFYGKVNKWLSIIFIILLVLICLGLFIKYTSGGTYSFSSSFQNPFNFRRRGNYSSAFDYMSRN